MSAYTDAVTANLEGLTAISTGACPGCPECMEHDGFTSADDHTSAWHRGDTCSDTHFSWCPCGICGSTLGGDRERWHALGANREILHFDDACTDCVLYLAYGDEPEQWGWNGKGGASDE